MKPVTVTQINEYIARRLREDFNLRNIAVTGEISGLSGRKPGGHIYFSLKDAGSTIRCAIWASNTKNIDLTKLENGRQITAVGDISPYARGGSYSFSIRLIEDKGEGDLMAEFIRVRDKLRREGIFDQEHKRPLPEFPARVGVVTSATGAAVEDIKKIITQKNDYVDVLIFPTKVQGDDAPQDIVRNIELANEVSRKGTRIDVLIVGRGGGSAEDLAAFNDEGVARAVYASEIPVISAVGHESDVSISDMAADVRAETPTAAADMAVPDTFALRQEITDCTDTLTVSLKSRFESAGDSVRSARKMLFTQAMSRIREARLNVEKAVIELRENDPVNIMNKGYAAVTHDGSIVSSAGDIEPGSRYKVIMKDGSFEADAVSRQSGAPWRREK
jgi:exodeoxyribonuclease VII large subunit